MYPKKDPQLTVEDFILPFDGALVIKETLGLSDEETVEQIRENPYLQYFLGFRKYTNKKPFDPSMMVRFRQRFSLEQLNDINETICEQDKKDDDEPPATGGHTDRESSGEQPKNKGKLVMDTTCVPADIRYLSLVKPQLGQNSSSTPSSLISNGVALKKVPHCEHFRRTHPSLSVVIGISM